MDTQIAQLIVNGIAVGSIIALAAVGLTLTYGILRLSNFAHGDFLTLGAYLTLLVNTVGINIWLSIILAAAGTVAVMLVSEKLLWSRMRSIRATSTTLIIISIGLALFLRNGIIFLWGGPKPKLQFTRYPSFGYFRSKSTTKSIVGTRVSSIGNFSFALPAAKHQNW